MNTLTTYFYAGANDSDVAETFIFLNGHSYVVAYIDVAIYYGSYIGADVPLAEQPRNLVGLQDVKFNAQIYKCSGGVPTSKYSTPMLILQQDIYDLDDPRSCLGTRYTFATKITEHCGNFCMVWSTNKIEIPYAANMIFIAAQNGVSDTFNLCD